MKGQRKFWTLLLARSCVVCQAAWDVALLNYNVIRYFMPEIKQKLRFYFWRVYVRIISCSQYLSPDIILHGWLGLKHQLTNFPAPAQCFPWLNLWVNQSLNYFGDTEAENKACRGQIWWLKCLSPWELVWFKSRSLTHGDWLRNKSKRGCKGGGYIPDSFKCANSHTCQFSLSLSPLSLSLFQKYLHQNVFQFIYKCLHQECVIIWKRSIFFDKEFGHFVFMLHKCDCFMCSNTSWFGSEWAAIYAEYFLFVHFCSEIQSSQPFI